MNEPKRRYLEELRALARNEDVLVTIMAADGPTPIYDDLGPLPVYVPAADVTMDVMPKRMRSKTADFVARVVKAIEVGEDPSSIRWVSAAS